MPPVLELDPSHAEALRAFLARRGFEFEARPHTFFLALGDQANVTFYRSGKVVVSGKKADLFAEEMRLTSKLPFKGSTPLSPPARPAAKRAAPAFRPRIGMDESGKGDYFGPLVAAAVLIPDAETERLLLGKGVRDSKALPDDLALVLDSLVRSRCPHQVVVMPPPRYNELHARIGNLNHMLAWAHARALEDLLADHPADLAVLDQFAKNPRTMQEALFDRGRRIVLEERPRAEADAAVAAASIVARAEFLRSLRELSTRFSVPLPKGAGPGVIDAARLFVRRQGRAALGEVAKLHFATTDSVDRRGGGAPPRGGGPSSDREEA